MPRNNAVKSFWVKDLKTADDKKSRVDILNYELGLTMLFEYLTEMKTKTLEGYSAYTDYNTANWQLQVAENNGRLKMIDELLSLLSFKDTNGDIS